MAHNLQYQASDPFDMNRGWYKVHIMSMSMICTEEPLLVNMSI